MRSTLLDATQLEERIEVSVVVQADALLFFLAAVRGAYMILMTVFDMVWRMQIDRRLVGVSSGDRELPLKLMYFMTKISRMSFDSSRSCMNIHTPGEFIFSRVKSSL